MALYKGIEVPDKLDGVINHMTVLETAREELAILGQQWDLLTILGQMSGSGTDMSGTRAAFQALTSDLLGSLGLETLKKTITSMTSKAQVTVDIVIRNLFERTADIGFLATDDDIRHFLKQGRSGKAPEPQAVARLRDRFSEYVAKYSVYNNIVLLDCQGNVMCQLDETNPVTQSKDSIVRQALTTEADFVETYRKTDLCNTGKESLIYSFRVTESNSAGSRPLGVLCLVFNFEKELAGVFDHLITKDDWVVLSLLDKEGKVIASSDQCQVPLGYRLEMAKKDEFKICKFAGRLYVSKTCETKGYQGFKGLGWYGHAMIPIEYAFDNKGEVSAPSVTDDVMNIIMENSALFTKELREISENAEQIQSELDQTVWNGNLSKDSDDSDISFMAKKVLLWEVGTTGSKTKNVFEKSTHSLHQTVVNTLLSDVAFSASLAIDIMDRNLYERANDCRWWALTTDFRKKLSQTELSTVDINKLQEILVYINGLYTVYTNLFLYDASGKIIAVSNPSEKGVVGKILSDDYIKQTLSIRNSQVYSVSPFIDTELYSGQHTYIYGAAITNSDNPTQVVGGIGIVFDSTPEFRAMIEDALPKNERGKTPVGCFGLLVERSGKVISSTDDELPPGAQLDIDPSLLALNNGESSKSIIQYRGQYCAVGVSASRGYREYKSESDCYTNDVLALTFIELGHVDTVSSRSGRTNRPIHVSHSVREAGVQYTEFATFYIGDSWLGMETKYVEGALSISDITMIPSNKPAFVGSIMYHGRPIGVLNPREVVGQEKKPQSKRAQVLIVKTDKGEAGILIEGLGQIPEIENHRIVKDNFFEGKNQKYIDAIIKPSGKDDERILVIVDPSGFLEAILSQEDTIGALSQLNDKANSQAGHRDISMGISQRRAAS